MAVTKVRYDQLKNLDAKESVRAATTENITLAGTQTVDGASLAVGDRVLVKDQSTGSQNGLYVVSGSAWTRTLDANTNTNLTPGMYVTVEEGTTNADTSWVLTTDAPITVDTTALSFAQTGAGPLANHDHTGDAGDGGQLEADLALVSTDITDGYVLTAVGDGSVAWEAASYASLAGMPKRATMWHDESVVTNGNAFQYPHHANQNYTIWGVQETPANGDAFTNGCYLRKGTYTFRVLGYTYLSRGKIDWTVDGESIVAGQDWYSAGEVYNVIKSTTNVTIATDGWHVITGTINGKHASSTNYYMTLTKFWFEPAAD